MLQIKIVDAKTIMIYDNGSLLFLVVNVSNRMYSALSALVPVGLTREQANNLNLILSK